MRKFLWKGEYNSIEVSNYRGQQEVQTGVEIGFRRWLALVGLRKSLRPDKLGTSRQFRHQIPSSTKDCYSAPIGVIRPLIWLVFPLVLFPLEIRLQSWVRNLYFIHSFPYYFSFEFNETYDVLYLFQVAYSSGVFELRLLGVENPLGLDWRGECCSGPTASKPGAPCPSPCSVRVRACLKHYQAQVDTTTPCTFGDLVTPVLGNNSLQLGPEGHLITFRFDFTWPVSILYNIKSIYP